MNGMRQATNTKQGKAKDVTLRLNLTNEDTFSLYYIIESGIIPVAKTVELLLYTSITI